MENTKLKIVLQNHEFGKMISVFYKIKIIVVIIYKTLFLSKEINRRPIFLYL